MGNLLMQIFVLLPLSAIESAVGVMIILSLVSFFDHQAFELSTLAALFMLALGIIVLVGLFFLERKIRDFDEFGVAALFAITMPVRIVFQLISILFAIISFFADSVDSDYECLTNSVGDYISYVFLGCIFDNDIGSGSSHHTSSKSTSSSSSSAYAPANAKSAGKKDLRMRNVCMQLFSLLPIAAGQFVLSYFALQIIGDLNSSYMNVIWIFLIFIGLLILSMISTRLRGHEPMDEYFDERFVYEKKAYDNTYHSDDEISDIIDRTYSIDPHASAPNVSGYKHKSGGWTSFLRPITILCFLSSIFLVFTQVISIIIALFVNPYKGRVFPWYGAVDFSRCNHPFLQKIMHFYLGFVVLSY